MPLSPHLRLHNDATSAQAKKGVAPIPKREGIKRKPRSRRTEKLRGAKVVEQNSRPSRETRGG